MAAVTHPMILIFPSAILQILGVPNQEWATDRQESFTAMSVVVEADRAFAYRAFASINSHLDTFIILYVKFLPNVTCIHQSPNVYTLVG